MVDQAGSRGTGGRPAQDREIEVEGAGGHEQRSAPATTVGAGDSGQGCHGAGEGKATYGTGSFVLFHTGDDASAPPHGLLKTAAADGYALEGAVLVAGAAVQWLRDGLGVIGAAALAAGRDVRVAVERTYEPELAAAEAEAQRADWRRAVARARSDLDR